MLPSLPALRAFDAAARLGSFQKAADHLSVSATAISHHVRGLEQQFGKRLFDRAGRTVRLTEDGRRLAEATNQAFSVLQTAIDRLRDQPRNVVRIAAGPIFTARWLIPRIGEFWGNHPGIELEFVPAYRPGSVTAGTADIIIRWERVIDMPTPAQKLLELTAVAVASPAYIDRHGPFASPSDLLHVPIMHQRNHWGWLDWFAQQNVTAPAKLRGPLFEDANILLRAAAEGQGAILGWLPLIGQDLSEGRITRLFDETTTPTHGYFAELRTDTAANSASRRAFDWLCAQR